MVVVNVITFIKSDCRWYKSLLGSVCNSQQHLLYVWFHFFCRIWQGCTKYVTERTQVEAAQYSWHLAETTEWLEEVETDTGLLSLQRVSDISKAIADVTSNRWRSWINHCDGVREPLIKIAGLVKNHLRAGRARLIPREGATRGVLP